MSWLKTNCFNKFILFCHRHKSFPFGADVSVIASFLKTCAVELNARSVVFKRLDVIVDVVEVLDDFHESELLEEGQIVDLVSML
jgi:hypothetical protein